MYYTSPETGILKVEKKDRQAPWQVGRPKALTANKLGELED